MLLLLTIFLFLFVPVVMLLLHFVRPRFNVQGFLAVLAVIAGWILVFLARPNTPRTIPLTEWQPTTLFAFSPSLIIDSSSWFFALALASLALTAVVTSISQLGQSTRAGQPDPYNEIDLSNANASSQGEFTSIQADNAVSPIQLIPGWLSWALILIVTSIGLLAVAAGNILTLLLTWAALDIIELLILLGVMVESRMRERIIVAFSARMAGLCIVLIAGVLLWSQYSSLAFDSISAPISTLLVLAAGLRLGVLPLHLPYPKGLPLDRNLNTVLRLVSMSASNILLVHLADIGVTGIISVLLIGLTTLAGLYAAVNWLRAKDEFDGQLYWLLGSSALVVITAILRLPVACLVWSITGLLSGGLIFSMPIRHRNLLPLALLGILNLTALPFSPTWQATTLYQNLPSTSISLPIFALFSFLVLLIQAFLLAGFIRHTLKGIFQLGAAASKLIERWVWFLYPLGLIFILGTHLLIGVFLYPKLATEPLSGWLIGPVVFILAVVIAYFASRSQQLVHPTLDPNLRSAWDRLLSFDWLYHLLWRLFRTISRIFALVSTILEGEGGLLWALVIFGLIFVFLQR